MRNFIIFFEEKEGSSPLVRLLDNHPAIDIVHRKVEGVGGWEPFDTYNCGGITPSAFRGCLEMIYGDEDIDMDAINSVYTRTSRTPLAPFDKRKALGFKVRFRSPMDIPGLSANAPLRNNVLFRPLSYGLRWLTNPLFRRILFDTAVHQRLVVFVAVRQDIFRWALSKYHGDGTGKRGHLQFKVAKGKLRSEEIPHIHVDPARFKKTIDTCLRSHEDKRRLISALREKGVDVFPLYYEDFLEDQVSYFKELLDRLGLPHDPATVDLMLGTGTSFKKVHGTDISTFVENHREISDLFGDHQHPWEGSLMYQATVGKG